MEKTRKKIFTGVLVGVVAAIIAAKSGRYLPESCKVYQEEMKQVVMNDGGFSGLITTGLSEKLVGQVIEDRYGDMTAQECTTQLPVLKHQLESLEHTRWAPLMPAAADAAVQANNACRKKRINGELKSHAESMQCSNALIAAAVARTGFPHSDLVEQFSAMRLKIGQKLDNASFGAQDDPAALADFGVDISQEERKRLAPH